MESLKSQGEMTQSCPHLAKKLTALLEAGKSLLALPSPPLSSNSNLKGSTSIEQDPQSPYRELWFFLPQGVSILPKGSVLPGLKCQLPSVTCQPVWVPHLLSQRLRGMQHSCPSRNHRSFWNLEMLTFPGPALSRPGSPSLKPLHPFRGHTLPIWPSLHHPSSEGAIEGEKEKEREAKERKGRKREKRKKEKKEKREIEEKRERWGVARGRLCKTESAQRPGILRYQAHQ